jgi:hypothetical protein
MSHGGSKWVGILFHSVKKAKPVLEVSVSLERSPEISFCPRMTVAIAPSLSQL